MFNFQDTFLSSLTFFSEASDLFIISHLQVFVNPFFEVFQNFFRCDVVTQERQLLYYIILSSVCQALFSTFFWVSLLPKHWLKSFRCPVLPSLRKLIYYIMNSAFCQRLFTGFTFCTHFSANIRSFRLLSHLYKRFRIILST